MIPYTVQALIAFLTIVKYMASMGNCMCSMLTHSLFAFLLIANYANFHIEKTLHLKPNIQYIITITPFRPVIEPEVLYDAGGEESPDSEVEEDRLMSHRLAAPPSSSER